MKYYINYQTGAGNKEVEGTLEEAKRVAAEGAAYTQQGIKIFAVDEDEQQEVSELKWYGVAAEEGDVATVNFGDFGFYGEWWDM